MDSQSLTIPIPEELWSTETGKPFQKCLYSEEDLHASSSLYLIEKVFQHGEPIIEYAISIESALEMNEQLSIESRKSIHQFLQQRANFEERSRRLIEDAPSDFEAWTNHCVVNQTPIDREAEYHLYGLCQGSLLLFGQYPFAMSGQVVEEMTANLSEETRGWMDDFMGTHFGSPGGSVLPKTILV